MGKVKLTITLNEFGGDDIDPELLKSVDLKLLLRDALGEFDNRRKVFGRETDDHLRWQAERYVSQSQTQLTAESHDHRVKYVMERARASRMLQSLDHEIEIEEIAEVDDTDCRCHRTEDPPCRPCRMRNR